MKRFHTFLLGSALAVLAGCASLAAPGYGGYYAGASCPAGTVMICVPESLRGCRCGTLIVR